jgi:hypothetical protein
MGDIIQSQTWIFYLSNGAFLSELTFASEEEVRRLFPDAKIEGMNVYLTPEFQDAK